MKMKALSILALCLILTTTSAGCLEQTGIGGGDIGGGFWRATLSPDTVVFVTTGSANVNLYIQGLDMETGEKHHVEVWLDVWSGTGDPTIWGIQGRQNSFTTTADLNGQWETNTYLIIQFNKPLTDVTSYDSFGIITLKIDGEPAMKNEYEEFSANITLRYNARARSDDPEITPTDEVQRNVSIFNPYKYEYTIAHTLEMQDSITTNETWATHHLVRGIYNITWDSGYRIIEIDQTDKVITLGDSFVEGELEFESGTTPIIFGMNVGGILAIGSVIFIAFIVILYVIFKRRQDDVRKAGKLEDTRRN